MTSSRSCETCEHWEERLRRCSRGERAIRVKRGCWYHKPKTAQDLAPPGDCAGQQRMFEG